MSWSALPAAGDAPVDDGGDVSELSGEAFDVLPPSPLAVLAPNDESPDEDG